jgi:hypothetical protein
MPKTLDIAGKRFRKLVALRFTGERNKHKHRLWECICDCGKTTVVPVQALNSGNTGSCGCAEGLRRHGGYKNGSYNTWRAMMRRCYNPKDKDFHKYGAVGVVVQDSWHEYLSFVADMGEPEGTETLHRVDPYGDYTKENCEWASLTRQAREVRLSKRNTTGFTGIVIRQGKFNAQITVQKKKYYGPLRVTIEEAIADRKALEEKYWGVEHVE